MKNVTRVLALNAYHGGSHRAFLDGWQRHSRLQFTTLTLPAYKWKWRMRHAAITFAEQVTELVDAKPSVMSEPSVESVQHFQWDAVFCTDMLNLAEFRGLCPESVRKLPTIAYFHENQLTYPNRQANERDLHFAFTNLTTALAADRVWFNSAFHHDEFITALESHLRRMPDYQSTNAPGIIRAK